MFLKDDYILKPDTTGLVKRLISMTWQSALLRRRLQNAGIDFHHELCGQTSYYLAGVTRRNCYYPDGENWDNQTKSLRPDASTLATRAAPQDRHTVIKEFIMWWFPRATIDR